MLKVALLVRLTGMWQGGVNYYSSLIKCFGQYGKDDIELNVFTDSLEHFQYLASHRVRIHKTDLLTGRESIRGACGKISERVFGFNYIQLKLLEKHGIDVLSHVGIGNQNDIATLPWMPDFQHKLFPDFFSKSELIQRDELVEKIKYAGNLLLSSESSRLDFLRFYPQYSSLKTHVLNFSSGNILDVSSKSLSKLQEKYYVKDNYVFVPNQFWIHKNHDVIINALQYLPPSVQVVCTGKQEDHRHPDYYKLLMKKAKNLNLGDKLLSLGSVPYLDVVSLMHNSAAVLNPSLFEGWSTTVEEAKSMCKLVLLSDIPVHREQKPARSIFFNPTDPIELANSLKVVFDSYSLEEENIFYKLRSKTCELSQRKFVLDFETITRSIHKKF